MKMVQVAKSVLAERKFEMRVKDVVNAFENQIGICANYRKVVPILKNDLKLSYR